MRLAVDRFQKVDQRLRIPHLGGAEDGGAVVLQYDLLLGEYRSGSPLVAVSYDCLGDVGQYDIAVLLVGFSGDLCEAVIGGVRRECPRAYRS